MNARNEIALDIGYVSSNINKAMVRLFLKLGTEYIFVIAHKFSTNSGFETFRIIFVSILTSVNFGILL